MSKDKQINIENLIAERVIRRICFGLRARARSLRTEARPYWLSNKTRMHQLKGAAMEFDHFAQLLEDSRTPDKPMFPAALVVESGSDDL